MNEPIRALAIGQDYDEVHLITEAQQELLRHVPGSESELDYPQVEDLRELEPEALIRHLYSNVSDEIIADLQRQGILPTEGFTPTHEDERIVDEFASIFGDDPKGDPVEIVAIFIGWLDIHWDELPTDSADPTEVAFEKAHWYDEVRARMAYFGRRSGLIMG